MMLICILVMGLLSESSSPLLVVSTRCLPPLPLLADTISPLLHRAGIGCRRNVRKPSTKHPGGYIDVGVYVPGCDMRLVDPVDGTPFTSTSTSDHDLPSRSGVLHLRGDSNFLGYWQNPSATAEALTEDGWVDTGDLVILDERTRHVWIVGRKKVSAPMSCNLT